jgi:hypothetical protein
MVCVEADGVEVAPGLAQLESRQAAAVASASAPAIHSHTRTIHWKKLAHPYTWRKMNHNYNNIWLTEHTLRELTTLRRSGFRRVHRETAVWWILMRATVAQDQGFVGKAQPLQSAAIISRYLA